ncbi:hypothetical protein D9M70_596010 [compost metagenome]
MAQGLIGEEPLYVCGGVGPDVGGLNQFVISRHPKPRPGTKLFGQGFARRLPHTFDTQRVDEPRQIWL